MVERKACADLQKAKPMIASWGKLLIGMTEGVWNYVAIPTAQNGLLLERFSMQKRGLNLKTVSKRLRLDSRRCLLGAKDKIADYKKDGRRVRGRRKQY